MAERGRLRLSWMAGAVLAAMLIGILGLAVHWRTEMAEPVDPAQASPQARALIEQWGAPRYSRALEELLIRDFFADRREGVFLDVGAFDYKTNSNTYYLDRHLGWSGVAVDAQPAFAEGYRRHRPRTRFYNFFVSDRSDEDAVFYVVRDRPQLSTAHRGQLAGRDHEAREVPTITLDDLLERDGVDRIDFLTMDIERWEPQALAGFDIARFKPALVCIESHEAVNAEILRYFSRHGYERIDAYLSLDERNWYFRPAPSLAER